MPLSVMPLGSSVHCVELYAGRGAQMVRSAGASAQVMAKEGDYVALKLPSTEVRLCLLYTSPSPRDGLLSRMPSSA